MAKEFGICGEVGGGGGLITRFFSTLIQIPTAQSGTLFTLTPPTGQRVLITNMATGSNTGNQVNMSLLADGVEVVNDQTLAGQGSNTQVVGDWNIGNNGFFNPVLFDVDAVVTLVRTTGTTTDVINYSYQFVE